MTEEDIEPHETGRAVRLRVNAAVGTVATQAGVSLLSLANVIVVGRTLGPSGRGTVAFLTTVGFVTSWLSTVGVDQSISNMAGQRPGARRALAGNAVALSAIFGGLAAAIVLGLTVVFPRIQGSAPRSLLIAVMVSVPVLVLQIYLRQLAAAQYHFAIGNVTALLVSVTNLCVNLGLTLAGILTVGLAIYTWLLGQYLATIGLCWYVDARLEGFGRPDVPLSKESVRFGIRAHISHTMNLGNYRADQWIMGVLSTPRQLGLYSVAVAWSETLFLLPQALMQVQRPDLVRASPRDAGRQTALVCRVTLLATIALCAVMWLAAPLLCVTVFGSAFRGSVLDLRIVVLGGFGIVCVKLLGSALTSQGRPLRESLGVAVSFATVVGLDFILIPSTGGPGASVASAVGYSAGGLVLAVILSRTLGVRMRALAPGPRTFSEMRTLASAVLRSRKP